MLGKLKYLPGVISRFFKRPVSESWIYLKITFFSFCIRMMVLLLPFRYTSKHLGDQLKHPNDVEPFETSIQQQQFALEIANQIRAVSKVVPWKSNCLVQATLGKKFLTQKNIKSIIFMGVKKDENNSMLAHAWLQTGSNIILGGEIADEYAAVSAYI